jgi:hypothetical protein
MAMQCQNPAPLGEVRGIRSLRRHVLALMLGAPAMLAAADAAPLRFAISETEVGDLNLNDARAAMSIWPAGRGEAKGIRE